MPVPFCWGQCHLFLAAHRGGGASLESSIEVKVLGLGQKVNDEEDPCLPLMPTLSLLLPIG